MELFDTLGSLAFVTDDKDELILHSRSKSPCVSYKRSIAVDILHHNDKISAHYIYPHIKKNYRKSALSQMSTFC